MNYFFAGKNVMEMLRTKEKERADLILEPMQVMIQLSSTTPRRRRAGRRQLRARHTHAIMVRPMEVVVAVAVCTQ